MKILNIRTDDLILFSDWKTKHYFRVGSYKIANASDVLHRVGLGPEVIMGLRLMLLLNLD